MEIAVKETYAHMLKDESLVQNSETKKPGSRRAYAL